MALITVFSLRQPDQVSKTEPWPGGPKSYLQQPAMATPVIQQKMEESQDNHCFCMASCSYVCIYIYIYIYIFVP